MDTYTQRVHVKRGVHEVDFGTCRVEGCTLEGMTLSADTWQRFVSDSDLRETYHLDKLNFHPLTGERWQA